MNDEANVGFVDAHAKGNGGNHDLELASEKSSLNAVAVVGLKSGVVGGGAEPAAEFGGERFGLLAGRRVDDGGAGARLGKQFRGKGGALGFRNLDDLNGEVVTTKAVDEDSGFPPAAEP